jgi:flavin reductase (DIM6/NTAB) family NADH-FMN oxidoreductase RutF
MSTPTDEPDGSGADPEHDAFDRARRRTLWALPTGLYLLGSRSGGERNLMTANWVVQVCLEPKLVAVGVEVEALTHRLVRDGGAFAVSLLARDDRAVVRKFVRPAVEGEDGTLNGFAVTAGTTGAPVLAQAAAWLDCEVRQQLDLGSHTLFVGEVVGCSPPEGDEVALLRMEDTRMNYGG